MFSRLWSNKPKARLLPAAGDFRLILELPRGRMLMLSVSSTRNPLSKRAMSTNCWLPLQACSPKVEVASYKASS